ncbi:molybdate ABC transporter substrate-binding protein [Thermodesulfovibrio thiophilus]|uniref:molybdate ABC transporter substrate-binding protein n=1 Tax=Thermodesulfovibrio thiophilus TaxID=340095 RepID=UPI0017A8D0AE|nr:molybdate ABC transporter substrate-binding protein [Thermodesulfovibrio thiophilus]HHW21137.1 molybdate ABC transporter substrate-binding protein [Thermodesulfovibrio thiophilus]
MKTVFIILLIIFSMPYFITEYTDAAEPQEITVSAAISLKNAFEEIGKLFELKYKTVKVRFNFGASGDLARQIEGGAPVDVFASADQKDMDDLEKKRFILLDSRINFAGNTVVLIMPVDSNINLKSFNDLKAGQIKRIAVGNPKTVPAGRYAHEVLHYFKLLPEVQNKLIYAENVRQVLDYVARKEVDAGIVYSTDAIIRAKEVKIITTAPQNSHAPVVYPVAVVSITRDINLSKAFVNFLITDESRAILKKYGFIIPKK